MNDKQMFSIEIPIRKQTKNNVEDMAETPMKALPDTLMEMAMPNASEKNESVRWILDTALPQQNHIWKELRRTAGNVGLRTLFFGVGDCFFLAALVLCVCLFPVAAVLAEMVRMAPCLFLASPAFYALAHLLTMWKEHQTRTLEWKRTWRIPYQMIMALRMLVFGAVSVVISVLLCILLWVLSKRLLSFVWLLSVAFSALFLYGSGSLLCQRVWGMRAAAFVPVVWIVAGLVPVVWEPASIWLMQLPVLVFVFMAVAGGIFYFYEIGQFLRRGWCVN